MWHWQNERTIIILLIIGILLVLSISICFVFVVKVNYTKHIENKNRIKVLKANYKEIFELSSIVIQEKERQRIGSDLHDSVINSLNILYLKSQAGLSEEMLINNIQEAISLTRRISHDLNLPFLEYQSIEDALETVVQQWSNFYSIDIKIDAREAFELSTEQKTHLVRIVQELMTNIHKHAQCDSVRFHLRLSAQFLVFKLWDNGKGFEVNKDTKGLGFKSIRVRANILKAIFKYKKQAVKGTLFLMLIKK